MYSALLRSNCFAGARGPLSIFHHSTSFLIPCNAVLSAEQCYVYNAHSRDMRLVCKTTTRTRPDGVYALTRVANEVPALKLTQPRIHCITLGDNRFAILPSLLFLSISLSSLRSTSTPFYSGSIFHFAFSSFSLSGFLRECDSSFNIYPRTPPADSALARSLFSFRVVRSPFLRRLSAL